MEDRGWEAFKLAVVVILSLGVGLLPYIDNFAHVGGFVFGFLRCALPRSSCRAI